MKPPFRVILPEVKQGGVEEPDELADNHSMFTTNRSPTKQIVLALVGAFLNLNLLDSSVSAGETRLDVSQIIVKSDAESILGETVTNPNPRNGDGKDGYYSKCNYYGITREKKLVIRLQQPGPGAIDPQQELDLLAASTGPMKTVEGLGEKAQMTSEGGQTGAASRVLMLYVIKGNTFITVGVGGFPDDDAALDKAKGVAQKLIERL